MGPRDDVRAADLVADHPADDGTHRTGNESAGAGTNGHAFRFPRLGN